jgi:hypothetical protein
MNTQIPDLSRLCVPIGAPLVSDPDVKDDACAICLESLGNPSPDGSPSVEQLTVCGHQFHLFCIANAMRVDDRCPLCRSDVPQAEQAQISQQYLQQAAVPARAPPPAVRRKAFLYVVARQLGSGPQTRNVKNVVLMMGHLPSRGSQYPYLKWGVPGGFEDSTDRGRLYNAVREFGEEMRLIAPGTNRNDKPAMVNTILTNLQSMGHFSEVAHNARSGYTAYALIVDNAMAFERGMGLPMAGRNVEAKARVSLSNETKGFTWISKWSMEHATRIQLPGHSAYTAVKNPLLPYPLRIRRGVMGPQLTLAFALAN